VNDDDGLALALDVGGTTSKAELGDRGGVIGAALLARDGWAPES
jgi:ethanolamine utilization protein EutA (predicted chaperonin)